MRRILATLTATCLVPVMALAQGESASDLLERAREARATWDESFPGFTADLVILMDGEATQGEVRVSPKGEVDVDAPEGKAREWAREQLRSEVMHHLAGPSPFGSQAEFAEPAGEHPWLFHDLTEAVGVHCVLHQLIDARPPHHMHGRLTA